VGDASFTVYFSANTDTMTRTGYVLVSSEYILDSVSVVQAPANPVEVILYAIPDEAGILEGKGIYGEGSRVTIQAIPNEGWKFDNWTENNSVVSTDSVWNFKLRENKTLYANFSVITDINDINEIPTEYNLYQNYPNPFNPTTTISFGLPEESFVTLNVYNLLGEKVLELINKDYSAGNYAFKFDASGLTSGIYIYQINAKSRSGKNFRNTQKMTLMK
jgi:hypothetical protein